jgi:hypothetical protein
LINSVTATCTYSAILIPWLETLAGEVRLEAKGADYAIPLPAYPADPESLTASSYRMPMDP